MALTYTAKALISGTHTKVFEGQTVSNQLTFTYSQAATDGTAINQSNLVWIDKSRSLAATSEDLDISGVLADAYGAAVVFSKITTIYIKNLSIVAGETLKIGGASSNAFLLFENSSDIYELGPNGVFFINEPADAGLPVTASTGDLLKLDSGAATLTFDIFIAGRSA